MTHSMLPYVNRERVRTVLLFATFVACCFDAAAVAAILLIVRWASQDPERDPVYLFFQRHFTRNERSKP